MAESAQTEAADEEAGMRDGGMQKQERSSEPQGPDAKCGLAAFLRRSDWPGVKALNGPCTSTAKTNCEMPIRGSKMQMTPDFEMLSREVEQEGPCPLRAGPPKEAWRNAPAQLAHDRITMPSCD
ncbi:predicted protein [Chaetomium globosum CBS 148.51]|uniref:Uncharacterized protein n=1 Tax=Chaetomium globosum (strain ATCC 6205 / CBS 148.51 / DSM 1962 / NBRC 6347 / NRRL 1970) TaxID=306901 RepID=Q2HBJ1_CHAGB|nr:uncharacterized protein CHGG_02413 [Chaetomium globosum CBS 148.51]EAQ90478.1 predicted protein [Chaetomium globosum CBS 148.51]